MRKFNADGSLDTSFGNNSVVSFAYPNLENQTHGFWSIKTIRTNDNKLLVLCNRHYPVQTPQGYQGRQVLVLKMNLDGTPDTTFGNGGYFTTLYSADSQFEPVDLCVSGNKIFILNDVSGGYKANVMRLSYDTGILDNSFGVNGIVSFATFKVPRLIKALSDGIIIDYSAGFSFRVLKKYDSDFNEDLSFGINGQITHPMGNIYDLHCDNEDNIIIAGRNDGHTALQRYTAEGILDADETTNANFEMGFGVASYSSAVDFLIQDDGKYLVCGDYQSCR